MLEKDLVMAMQDGNQDTKNRRKKMMSFISFGVAVVVGLLAYVIIIYGPDIVRGIISVFSKK
ncbi:hypothetical protein GGR07_001165 [Bacteroides pyogenes]|nr:hypothetical protein [Bacteroides pyogenes]SUV33082.1 Uncharacterised protein [Bacteroides pyogenes]